MRVRMIRAVTMLTAGLCVCLATGSAYAQRGGRSGNRTSAIAPTLRSASSTANSTSGSTSTGQTTGTSGGAGCPSGGTSSGTSTSSGTTTTAGATSSTGVTAQSAATTSSTGTITAQQASASRVVLQWSGNTRNVQKIYLGVLDANYQVIDQSAVTQLPARATLSTSAAAKYYGVQVVYANGTSQIKYTPIR